MKPWEYQNPYVVRKRGRRPTPDRPCSDCYMPITPKSVRCMSCAAKVRAGTRRGRLGATTLIIADLIARKPQVDNTCIAKAVGVSRERVRQIRAAHNLGINPHSHKVGNTLISWPCPSCGAEVKMWTYDRNQRNTALCATCRRQEAGLARRIELRPVVCPDCGRKRGYKNRANALAKMKLGSIRCQSCAQKRRGAREKTAAGYVGVEEVLCKR